MVIHHFEIPKITQKRLIDAGFSSEQDFIGKNEEEIRSCGVGEKGLYELKLFLKHEFGIKIVKPPKKKVIDNIDSCRKVVEHFLSHDINWPRELKSANSLLKDYDLDFLLKIPPPPRIYSLGYFFQDFGQKYLSDNAPMKIIDEEKSPGEEKNQQELEERKYTTVESKPKSLKSFLGIN